ncbi:MAG: HD domain-containing protein [Thermotogae bacterium]|nr:HD domain-containing protein [Thermotogota bacterium]
MSAVKERKAKTITLEDLKKNPKVEALIIKADKNLEALGYTEHGKRHVSWVAKNAGRIMRRLGFPERRAQLAEMAGYLHDIGNAVNRVGHEHVGALLAKDILTEMGMPYDEVLEIMAAIGNHHEESGYPVSDVAAALIIADKADVHRTRVRPQNRTSIALVNDIHDRVNYAATLSRIEIDPKNRIISYNIEIDINIAPVFEYFEIFLGRLIISRKAAKVLNAELHLYINGVRLA